MRAITSSFSMHDAIPYAVLAIAFLLACSQQPCRAAEWRLKPLPDCQITAQSTDYDDVALRKLCDGNLGNNPHLSDLAKTELTFSFRRPVKIRNLALIRVGWSDWAQCEQIRLSINDRAPENLDLRGPLFTPDVKHPSWDGVDIVPLNDDVSSIVIAVSRISGKNGHGTLEVAEAVPAPASIDFNPLGGVKRSCSGMTLRLAVSENCKMVTLTARSRVFRSESTWIARKPLPSVGEVDVSFRWEEFSCAEEPEVPLNPTHMYALEILGGDDNMVKALSWAFTDDGKTDYPPAWEQLPALDASQDQDGWRPGIPAQGFGRYGWLMGDGLLVGNVNERRFLYEAIDGEGRRETASFLLSLGLANELKWIRRSADWTGAEHLSLYTIDETIKKEFDNKAFGEYDKSHLPERLIYSTLAPGFLVQSQSKLFSLRLESGSSDMQALCVTEAGLTWHPLDQALEGNRLKEGWLVVVTRATPTLPLLLVLQKIPQRISLKEGALYLQYAGPLGYLGVGTPSGYRKWNGNAGSRDAETENLAQASRLLAGILRSYPRHCRMTFREDGDQIRIREIFSHVVWENDWNDPAIQVAPLNPLLAFAKSRKYPVQYDTTAFIDAGIPTKYGPYLYMPGQVSEYALPIPPTATTIYLAPKEIPAELQTGLHQQVKDFDADTNHWLQKDCLSGWFLVAPAALSTPLLRGEDRDSILAAWRERLNYCVKPNLWHLRTEPFSGARYVVSFGWKEKNTGTLGDVNSGNCAFLHGMYTYAQASGDWDFIKSNWAVIEASFRYILMQHDWVHMQTGAREHSGASAIDMDVIGYLGAISFMQMAEAIGASDNAALARLCVSRLALSTGMRWLGRYWIQPDTDRSQWMTPSLGLSEGRGFDMPWFDPMQYPDLANSEIALSLSWVGQFPEVYDLHLWALGTEFWKWFEGDYVETKLPDWRKDYPGNRNNHAANIAAHLYMRGLLGYPLEEIRKEMLLQTQFSPPPSSRIFRENSALYAMLLGRDFPLVIKSLGLSSIRHAVFSETERMAELHLISGQPTSLVIRCNLKPLWVELNGKRIALPFDIAREDILLVVPQGTTVIRIQFPAQQVP